MKNLKTISVLGIGLLILLGAGYFILSININKTTNNSPTQTEEPIPELPKDEAILTLSPEEIGLVLATANDNKHVIIKIDKPQGIETIEYELTWGAKVKDKETGELLDIGQGTTSGGEPILIDGKSYKHEIKLGTCSDVCHYDQGVNNIKIILKIAKTDGKLYQSEKTLEI